MYNFTKYNVWQKKHSVLKGLLIVLNKGSLTCLSVFKVAFTEKMFVLMKSKPPLLHHGPSLMTE